ncbi:MAG: hypothetical protein WKF97_15160 [Chitinophagaceae bacterium]
MYYQPAIDKSSIQDLCYTYCRTAFALETQHFPNSTNQPALPGTVLEPSSANTSSVYKFPGEND